jgi:hypothetical protein
MGLEQRKQIRNGCFLRGDIIVNENVAPIPCEIHDISDRGMRLVVLNALRMPGRFIVSIPRRHVREIVRVVRRTSNELGVIIETPTVPT